MATIRKGKQSNQEHGGTNSNGVLRESILRLRPVRPHIETWALNDDGLELIESIQLSSLSHDQLLSLAERIERIGHAVTAEDIARILNISRITIFKHAAAGRIPSFRIGTSVRFDPRSIAQWLRKQ